MASVSSTEFSNNTAASLGSQDYINQIKAEGVERCFNVNGNGFVNGGPTKGGNISVQTENPGTDWAQPDSFPCFKCTVSNQTGTTIDIRQDAGGAVFPIPTGQIFTFEGLTNTDQLQVKRSDNSNTQVTVALRWAL